MIKVKNLKNILEKLNDETIVALSWNGMIQQGAILKVTDMEVTTAGELIDYDDCGCDQFCNCPKISDDIKNRIVLLLHSDRCLL